LTGARTTIRAVLVLGVVLALDQASKALVRRDIAPGEKRDLLPGLDLVNVRNRGVAFGMFSDGGTVLVVIGAAALVALLVFFLTHTQRPLVWLPTGLLVGGATGNLIDRAHQGSVTDFIDPPRWPAFNLADVSITLGVLALLYVLEGPPRRREAERSATEPTAAAEAAERAEREPGASGEAAPGEP
jgi:signal peptidase II